MRCVEKAPDPAKNKLRTPAESGNAVFALSLSLSPAFVRSILLFSLSGCSTEQTNCDFFFFRKQAAAAKINLDCSSSKALANSLEAVEANDKSGYLSTLLRILVNTRCRLCFCVLHCASLSLSHCCTLSSLCSALSSCAFRSFFVCSSLFLCAAYSPSLCYLLFLFAAPCPAHSTA